MSCNKACCQLIESELPSKDAAELEAARKRFYDAMYALRNLGERLLAEQRARASSKE